MSASPPIIFDSPACRKRGRSCQQARSATPSTASPCPPGRPDRIQQRYLDTCCIVSSLSADAITSSGTIRSPEIIIAARKQTARCARSRAAAATASSESLDTLLSPHPKSKACRQIVRQSNIPHDDDADFKHLDAVSRIGSNRVLDIRSTDRRVMDEAAHAAERCVEMDPNIVQRCVRRAVVTPGPGGRV